MFRSFGLRKETVSLMMRYKNTIAVVRSPEGDPDFFHTDTGVLQGDE